jgi:hypothetical protein
MNQVGDVTDFKGALKEFEEAWEDPRHTRFDLPPVRVNQVLRDKYRADKPVQMSRAQLWDMELKKAWNPRTYIPYVVSEAKSWGRHELSAGTEHFLRSSIQIGWITADRGLVLEEVFVDHAGQRVLFMGRQQFTDGSQRLRASTFQPLFHVEHAVGGSNDDPTNLWRIVVLTDGHDERYAEPFKEMVRLGWLPGFVEIYVEQQFTCGLTRKAL